MKRPIVINLFAACIAVVLAAVPVSAVVLNLNEFDTDTENWATRDSELSVSQDAFSGGVLSGSFGPANPGDVITDAFRLTTIPSFPTHILTSLSFDFYSVNVLPSDLLFRFGDGATTFFRSLSLGSVGGWSTYSLALDNTSGWIGGAPSSFTNVLNAATFYDIQLTQNGTNTQTFYVDNFQLEGELPGYAGDLSAVPEPGTLSLMFMAFAAVFAMRRYRYRMMPARALGMMMACSFTASLAHAESFDAGAADWVAMSGAPLNLSQGTNGNPGGALAGTFSAQQTAYPQAGSFIGPTSFVAENLIGIGDLRGHMLRFDFKAVTTNPAAFRVRIGDGTSKEISCFMSALVKNVGQWHSFRLSLASAHAGSWDGDTDYFDQIMNGATTFHIDISRNGEKAQTYLLDNVSIDALPDSGSMVHAPETSQVQWQHLRSGDTYRVEATATLNPPVWNEVETFVATNDFHVTDYGTTNNLLFFRIVMP